MELNGIIKDIKVNGDVWFDNVTVITKEVKVMARYTDDEIRNLPKITCKIAGEYLGISSVAVSIGMRNNLLPIGFAVHHEERDRTYAESWSYHIVTERLIAYKYGKINEVHVQNIEKNLAVIAEKFDELRQDLVFILSEDADQQT